ncbi:MAG: hypothetical protein KKD44_16690, partial [Proteobacteria bacterium]|nr:hypothetical protein [Pseudomonadota bacterium]
LIFSQVSGENRHMAYRKKVQGYSGEEKKMSEDIHMGLVAGTKTFAAYIKKKYMPENPNEEIPQQKKEKDDYYDIEFLFERASSLLGCDPEVFRAGRRITQVAKRNRDIMIYLLWKTGAFTNKEIAVYFGLGYSAVSRCVSNCNEMIKSDKAFKKGYNSVKSLIKM